MPGLQLTLGSDQSKPLLFQGLFARERCYLALEAHFPYRNGRHKEGPALEEYTNHPPRQPGDVYTAWRVKSYSCTLRMSSGLNLLFIHVADIRKKCLAEKGARPLMSDPLAFRQCYALAHVAGSARRASIAD
jgi:hypothetical protein